jgi:hypothetical protein
MQEPQATLHARRRIRAGMSPATRLLVLCAAAVAVHALATAADAQTTTTARLESPRLADIAVGPAFIRDAQVPKLRRFLTQGSYWGGPYTVPTGETVVVYASNAYPQDPTLGQRWADFLASLIHGPELSAVTVYLAPLSEVQGICGQQALACYSDQQNLMVAPGDDPAADTSAEAVVTHEYGHHVAAHRSNAPWAAIEYGPKRWASYEQVCSLTRTGQLFPGAEDAQHYELNPGEGWAETYRVLNERNAGLPEVPWEIVTQSLYPDDTALADARLDVTSPWLADSTSTRTGSVTKAKRVRTYTVAMSLDGTMKVTLKPPAHARLAIDVYAPSSTRVAHAVTGKTVSLTTTICGARSAQIRVTRVSGAGAFRLSTATP